MNNKYLFLILIIILCSCQTVSKKIDENVQKEERELSKLLNSSEDELKIEMGEPDEILNDEKGSKFYIYKKKKYGITCEKKFEVDKNNMIVGVSSRGCF